MNPRAESYCRVFLLHAPPPLPAGKEKSRLSMDQCGITDAFTRVTWQQQAKGWEGNGTGSQRRKVYILKRRQAFIFQLPTTVLELSHLLNIEMNKLFQKRMGSSKGWYLVSLEITFLKSTSAMESAGGAVLRENTGDFQMSLTPITWRFSLRTLLWWACRRRKDH